MVNKVVVFVGGYIDRVSKDNVVIVCEYDGVIDEINVDVSDMI